MKTNCLVLTALALATAATGLAFSTGAPNGNTGAPGEDTCAACHGGAANSGGGKVTVSFPSGTTYAPGQTYRMRVTVEDATATRWGFSLTVRKEAATDFAGRFAVPATPTPAIVQISSAIYLTHSAVTASTFRAQRTQAAWEFDWTAPAAGTGAVRFYAAGNAANNNGASDAGDKVYTSNLALSEAVATTPTTIASGNTVIPQFVFGGGWSSSLYFTNSTAAQVSFPVRFYNDSAAEMSFAGGSVKQMIIPSKGTAIIQAQNTGSLTQGWATYDLPTGVVGYAVFRQAAPGIADQEAVVPFSSTSATKASLTYDDSNLITAAAIWYNGTSSATVTVVARDEGGTQIGTATLTMAPGTKQAFAVVDKIPAVGGKRGVLEFSTPSGSMAVLGLRFAGSAFTSIPAAP